MSARKIVAPDDGTVGRTARGGPFVRCLAVGGTVTVLQGSRTMASLVRRLGPNQFIYDLVKEEVVARA